MEHLSSDSIYKYAYIGHGAIGTLTGLKGPCVPPTEGAHRVILADRYTRYGIAEMRLVACESNEDASLWRKNLSAKGILMTARGKLRIWKKDYWFEYGED